MPHECTNCARTFPDGSKEMLSGCPDCGGNKFQFAPSGRVTSGSSDSSESAAATATETASASDQKHADPEHTDPAPSAESTGTVERAAETVRGWVTSDSSQSDDAARATTSETGPSPETDPSPDTDPSRGSDTSSEQERPGSASQTDDPPKAWPDADETAPADSSDEPGEFSEWPETARRPEDRSTPPADGSSGTDGRPPTNGSSGTDGEQSQSGTPARGDPGAADPAANGSVDKRTRARIADSENSAQSDARTEVVSTDDLPGGAEPSRQADDRATGPNQPATAGEGEPDEPPEHGRVVSEPSGEQPSIEELRAELNEQFESIKIVSPGQYELNLMELYNREEYIISLQEDGRYVIDVPDSWRADNDDE